MTQQEYQKLINDCSAAGRIVDYVRSDRGNLCLPSSERSSDEDLEQAEEHYAELTRVVNSVRLGLIKLAD